MRLDQLPDGPELGSSLLIRQGHLTGAPHAVEFQSKPTERTMPATATKTFRFDATWIGDDGIESEILTIQAATLKEATAAAVVQINGINSFADCLIDLQRLR